MRSLLQLPIVRGLHARRLLFPAILGLAVAGVLVHGALRRAAPESLSRRLQLPLPSISVPALRPELEKTPLTYEADYWQQLGENARNKLVRIGPNREPAVMVAPGVALTSVQVAEDMPAGPTGEDAEQSGPLRHRLLGVDPDIGIALFAVKQPSTVGIFSARDLAGLRAGSYAAAVSVTPEGDLGIAPGHIVSITHGDEQAGTSIEASLAGASAFPVAAVLDLDGRMVGVSVRDNGSSRIIGADTITRVVQRVAQGETCQAIEVGGLSDEVARLLGVAGGVLVENVRTEAFVPEPSVREGDVLLSWNEQAVSAAEQFKRLYTGTEPGTLVRYTALRNRRNVSGGTRMPGPDCRPARDALSEYPTLGLTLEREDGGWRVARVATGGAAEEAGLAFGDLITGIDGRDIPAGARSPIEGLEQNQQPVVLTVRRNGRVKMLAVRARSAPRQTPGTD